MLPTPLTIRRHPTGRNSKIRTITTTTNCRATTNGSPAIDPQNPANRIAASRRRAGAITRIETMQVITILLVALTAQAGAKKAQDTAKITITAETACGHCTFGFGDSCALCLKLDDVTPILLEGKPTEEFFDSRLNSTLIVVEGILSVNKDKRLVLKADKARAYTEKEKGKAPNKGEAHVEGEVIAFNAKSAIRNGDHPIVLAVKETEGKSATMTGILAIDKDGKLRLDAKKAK
jgi:hypothetical protein